MVDAIITVHLNVLNLYLSKLKVRQNDWNDEWMYSLYICWTIIYCPIQILKTSDLQVTNVHNLVNLLNVERL